MLLQIPSSCTSFLLAALLVTVCSDLAKASIIQDCPVQLCTFRNVFTFEDLQEENWANRLRAKTVICTLWEMLCLP